MLLNEKRSNDLAIKRSHLAGEHSTPTPESPFSTEVYFIVKAVHVKYQVSGQISDHPLYKEKFLFNTRNQWMSVRKKDAVTISNPHSAFVICNSSAFSSF